MNRAVLLAALLAGCCGHPETDTAPECLCDCPNGPPPEGQISTFCLAESNAGEACCLGGDNVGTCIASECVAAP